MPVSSPSESGASEAAICAAVRRLSRPDGQGGAVIERAAIVAEGRISGAIEAWVIDNGGRADAETVPRAIEGLHRFQRDTPTRAPRRYVLSAAAMGALS